MLLLSVIFTWFAVLAPSMAETELERRVAALEYKFARQERKLDGVEKDCYAVARSQGLTENSVCPNGFEAFEDSCYFFSVSKDSFRMANSICNANHNGAYLAEINNLEENTFLKGMSLNLGDTFVEDSFMWENSRKPLLSGDFNDWGTSEPNGGSSENCVLLDDNQNMKWADYSCSSTFRYICEQEMLTKRK